MALVASLAGGASEALEGGTAGGDGVRSQSLWVLHQTETSYHPIL
jgi:hypothetical protein